MSVCDETRETKQYKWAVSVLLEKGSPLCVYMQVYTQVETLTPLQKVICKAESFGRTNNRSNEQDLDVPSTQNGVI